LKQQIIFYYKNMQGASDGPVGCGTALQVGDGMINWNNPQAPREMTNTNISWP
jgi:hypothetical protein